MVKSREGISKGYIIKTVIVNALNGNSVRNE